MALKFNGTSGYLKSDGAQGLSYPYWQIGYVSADGTSATYQMPFGQGQAAADYYDGMTIAPNVLTTVQAWSRHPGESNVAGLTATVDATLKLAIVVFVSKSVRKIAYASNTFASSTFDIGDNASSANRITIGGMAFNSTAAFFLNGSVGEFWWGLGDLSADTASVDALLAKTLLGENVPGRIDGFKLADVADLTSFTGTRTLTVVGGVTNSSVTHPVARVTGATITLTGANCTQSATSSTGAVTVTAPVAGVVNLAGSNSTQGATSSTGAATVTQPVGTITTEPFKNWSNQVQANLTVPNVVVLKMDRSVALSLANQTTNGSGVLTIANAAITAGTSYMLATFNADGSARGFKKYAAA
jgi:hypothetical protein